MPLYRANLRIINRISVAALCPKCYLVAKFTTTFLSPLYSVNKEITKLVQNGQLEDARKLFDKLPQRNTVTWNSMLTGYVRHREVGNARKLFDEIPKKDVVSWNLMISVYVSCQSNRYLDEGRYLFDKMGKRDSVSWNTMISGYAKNGKMDEAMKLFNAMPRNNVITWNTMIMGFLNDGDVWKATELFKTMPKRDSASLSGLVSGLIKNGHFGGAENVLFEYGIMASGKEEDLLPAFNTLIAGYGQKGMVEDARRIFDQISLLSGTGKSKLEKNVVSWNSMIMCYVKAGNLKSARELFDQMEYRDIFSWNTMISGYVHASDMLEATKLFCEMKTPDAVSWNSIISGYTLAGKMEMALDFFQRMPQKNLVGWNTVIAGYGKNGDFEEAIKLFVRMRAEGGKPDHQTLTSVLNVCGETAAYGLGMQIHQLVTKIVIPDIPLNNALITMYARCGLINTAETIFNNVNFQRNVISWNAMIGAYASNGYAKEALKLFETMKRSKVTPTYITFISVLSACVHCGLLEEGKSYFRSMVSDFGIMPEQEHYSLLVDIIGRCGHVEEAMDFISRMPVKPDKFMWGALLGACRVHGNLELAGVAAEALTKLEPRNSGPYVLLYNMYVDAGRWIDADNIRKIMDGNNLRTHRGYSRVDSGN